MPDQVEHARHTAENMQADRLLQCFSVFFFLLKFPEPELPLSIYSDGIGPKAFFSRGPSQEIHAQLWTEQTRPVIWYFMNSLLDVKH